MAKDEDLSAFQRFYLDPASFGYIGMPTQDELGLQTSDLPIRFMPSADNAFGSQEYFNDQMTAEKKANDMLADPAFLARLSTGVGGVRPEDFQPTVTYQPVKAPGYQTAMWYANSDDPVTSFIGKSFLDKRPANWVENNLRLLAEEDPEVMKNLPRVVDQMTGIMGNAPDWGAVRSMIQGLEKQIIADPAFSAFDPLTQNPANAVDENGNPVAVSTSGGGGGSQSGGGGTEQYTMGPNGEPMMMTTTPTPIMEAWSQMGLHNPFETYDPDLLATSGQLRARGKAQQRFVDAEQAYTDAMNPIGWVSADKPWTAQLPNLGFQSLDTKVTPEMRKALLDLALKQGGDVQGSSLGEARDIVTNAMGPNDPFGGNEKYAQDLAAQMENVSRTPAATNLRRANRQVNEILYKANKRKTEAQNKRKYEQSAMYWNQLADQKRQRQAQQLYDMGYSPFADQMRAREANVYGW